jgi:hypothetical protein
MDPIVTSGIIQGGASLLGMGIGGLQQGAQNKRQKDLMNLQFKNQKKLNEQGADLSYENWLRTNYSAQRAEMEKAGLNVGMMYGMGGAGGTLTGGSGGSAAGGQAAAPNNQMAMLLGDLAANIELKKAQARNLDADTENKPLQGGLLQTQIDSNKLINAFNTENFETALKTAEAELDNTIANTNKQVAEGKLSEIDAKTRNWENIQNVLNTIADTKKMNAEVQQQWKRIAQGWEELALKNKGLNIEQQKTNVQEFGAETQRNYPNVWNVIGKSVNDFTKTLRGLVGQNEEGNRQTKVK